MEKLKTKSLCKTEQKTDQVLPEKASLSMNLDSFSGQSPCQNNGGCSQFCVLKPNGRTCLCGAGMKLAEDGISCKSKSCCTCRYEPLHECVYHKNTSYK